MKRVSLALVMLAMIAVGCGGSSNQDLELAAKLIGTWLLENVVIDGVARTPASGTTMTISESEVTITQSEFEIFGDVFSGFGETIGLDVYRDWHVTGDVYSLSPEPTAYDPNPEAEIHRISLSTDAQGVVRLSLSPIQNEVFPGTPSEYQYRKEE